MNYVQERASSGIPGLDDILGGEGFPRNQMYLVEGNPGAVAWAGVRRGGAVGRWR